MAPVAVTQEKDHKGERERGPGEKAPKTLVGRAILPSSPPPRPSSQAPRASSRPPAATSQPGTQPMPRGLLSTPLSRRQQATKNAATPRSAPENLPPLEEISSSLLLPDDSASGALPGLEELSGSLLLEDPTEVRHVPGEAAPTATATAAATAHVTSPAAAAHPEPPAPAAHRALLGELPAPAAHGAMLGMPELPTSTPAPNLDALPTGKQPTATLRPADTTPQPMVNPSSSSMMAALPADGVPPPPEQMFEALHGFEAAQADATAPLQAVPDEPAPPPATTTTAAPGDVEVTALPRGSLVVATDAIKRVLETLKSALGDESGGPRRRWFLPAIALAGLVVGVAVVAGGIAMMRKSPDESEARPESSAALPTAAAPEKASATDTPPSAPVASAAVEPPATVVESVGSTTPCKVTGKPRVVAPTAIVSAGVEVRTVGNDVALGFAPNEHQATAVRIDPASLSLSSTVDAQSTDAVRRVVPLASADGALSIAADADRDGDLMQGRRTVPLDPPLDIGAAGGKLAWAHPGGPPSGSLWPLDGSVEALRGATDLGGTVAPAATAIALRLGGAIWMGTATGRDALSPQGALSRAAGLGDTVGSPAIAINDGVVIVAWADRASSNDPWSLRWVRFKAGEPAGEPGTFTPPAGGKGEQAMSPGLAAVPGGRFLLVWTDGPAARHDVRALTLSHDGAPLGKPLNISNRSANAGQGQAAVNAARQGLVAFLESADSGFRVVATAITCGP